MQCSILCELGIVNVVQCKVCSGHCVVCEVCRFSVNYTACGMPYVLLSVQCAVLFKVCSVQCAVCTEKSTAYSVQCCVKYAV